VSAANLLITSARSVWHLFCTLPRNVTTSYAWKAKYHFTHATRVYQAVLCFIEHPYQDAGVANGIVADLLTPDCKEFRQRQCHLASAFA